MHRAFALTFPETQPRSHSNASPASHAISATPEECVLQGGKCRPRQIIATQPKGPADFFSGPASEMPWKQSQVVQSPLVGCHALTR